MLQSRTLTPLATLIAGALFAGAAATAVAAGLTVDDMLAMQRVSDPAVSPDGRWVAFAVRDTDLDANRGRSDIWLAAVDADQPHVRPAAVGVEVGVAHGERDGSPVGRNGRIGDPLHGQHVVDRQAGRRGGGTEREQDRKRSEANGSAHRANMPDAALPVSRPLCYGR